MRITFVTPDPGLTGGIRAIANYAVELARLGHRVTAVSSGPRVPTLRQRVRSLVHGRGWPARPKRGPSHFDELPGVTLDRLPYSGPIRADDVPASDVVIATWWETAEWVHALPADKGAKVYFVQHHETVFNNQPVARVAATYRLPMAKICCATWLKELMRSEYGDAAAQVVPYGIDHATFTAPPRGKQAAPTVGFMYSPTWFKGVDIAIAAIERAKLARPALRVVAFGDYVRNESIPLPDYVEYERRPTQARIAEIYASADAWLFSSRCEGFGLPILEAMACRTPVIGTPTGAAPDVLPRGGGRLTLADDPASMADAILAYADLDDAAWRRLSDAAFATAAGFRWDQSARLFETYLTCVARGLPLAA